MSPFPGAWTILDGIELKIWRSRIHSSTHYDVPGMLKIKDKMLLVQTGQGELELLEVQMAGKRRMNARDFINGYKIRDWSLT